MSADRPAPVLRFLRGLATADAGRLTDRELLGRFAAGGDAGAFAALVARHGPMVYGLCRNVLRNEHDADDAFQATFLVLARRAGAVRRQESVGGWLYGVARRIAVRSRTAAVRRLARERRPAAPEPRNPVDEASVAEVHEVLAQELARLPAKFREPVVLCCLQGLARDEAALRLGWPASVLKSRLEQGRDRLRVRLARRGLALAAVLGVALLGGPAGAAFPAALADAAARAAAVVAAGGAAASVVSAPAAALTNEALNAMFRRRLRVMTAVTLGAAVVASATGLIVGRVVLTPPAAAAPVAKGKAPAAATDADKLQGTWAVVELVVNGQKVLPNDQAKGVVVFKGDGFRFVITAPGEADLTRTVARFKLDPAKSPRTIDATAADEAHKGEVIPGIYELDGDDLRLCLSNEPTAARPTDLKGEGKFVLFKLKRSKD